MRNKIAVLSVCITLVYWMGGLTGCATSPQDAQNEDMLKEDKSIFDVSPPAEGGNQFQTRANPKVTVFLAALQNTQTITEEVSAEDATEPVARKVDSDTQISVTGFDRSSWVRIDVSPLVGTVNHDHSYHADKSGRLFTHTTVDLNQSSEDSMQAALDDTQCHTFQKREWATALIQPLKFCWDTFTLPYNATVKKPFWQDAKSDE